MALAAPNRAAPNYKRVPVKTLKTRGPKRGINFNVKVPHRTVLNPVKSRKVARPNTNAY